MTTSSGGEKSDTGGSVGVGFVREKASDKVNKMSYSDRLKTNINYSERLKRNILEIYLEKTHKEADIYMVNQDSIARVFKTLGIDIDNQVEGYQVQNKGQVSVISAWMKPGIGLERFCRDMNIKVTEGVMTGMIKPASRKEVTVTISGLDFNTPDTFIFEYLNKFGEVSNKVVIYSKFEEGAFKGKFNGERKYQVDFTKSNTNMGTFHLIDGCKVKVFFRGNIKTCGRCHKSSRDCPGQGIAKDCNSDRVMLSSHMKQLWDQIGFKPTCFELDELDTSENDKDEPIKDAPLLNSARFPSNLPKEAPSTRDIEKYDGITVKNIPSTLDDKQILTFLFNYGVPHDHGSDLIGINRQENRNTWVVIEGLSPEEVNTTYKSIHFPETKQKFFDAPLYCRPLRSMTPLKQTAKEVEDNKTKTNNKEVEKPKQKEPALHPVNDPTSKKTPLIPGLTKSQKKKAEKKAKEKLKAEEASNKIGKHSNNDEKITEKKTRKDFMKTKSLDSLEDHGFNFDEIDSGGEDSSSSKFFTKSPLTGGATSMQQTQKRLLSPEAPENRNTRQRSESLSFHPCLVSKLYANQE